MKRDPSTKYRPFPPIDLARSPLAHADHHPRADLAVDRSARRQPGADRADGRRAQAAHVPTLVKIGFKEIEVGFPVGVADRLRLRAQADRGGPASPTTSTIQVLTQSRDELIRAPSSRCAAPSARSCTSTTRRRRCSAASSRQGQGRASSTSPCNGTRAVPQCAAEQPGHRLALRVLARRRSP